MTFTSLQGLSATQQIFTNYQTSPQFLQCPVHVAHIWSLVSRIVFGLRMLSECSLCYSHDIFILI